jgi:serine protease
VPDFLGWVQDEVVVVMRSEASRQLVVSTNSLGRPTANDSLMQGVIDIFGVTSIRRQFQSARPQTRGSQLPDLTGHYKVRFPTDVPLDVVVDTFELLGSVDHVERIGMHSLYQQTPNDTYYQNPPASFPYDQWHYWNANSIDADQAWDAETGDSNVLVGILDSGTRYFHIDIGGPSAQWGPSNPYAGGNVFINPGETPGNGVDDDGNGYVDDTIGWDFVSSGGGAGVKCIDQDCSGADNDPDDGDGHGTHVSGTVGAITNNGIQVAGIAGGFSDASGLGNGVRLVPMRIGYHARYQGIITGIVRMDWAAEAMNYLSDLVDAGHNVASINCSWGSSNSGGLGAAVSNLVAHDVVIVHAAGNSGSSSADFLGNAAGVMNVAATDINGDGASFSNYGSWVDVAAPGVEILSTYRNPDDADPGAHYIALLDGTSMSSPHVAGIVALLESCNPGLSASQKFNLITANTDPYNDTRDLGSGIANAKLAFDAAGCGGTPCDVTAGFSGTPTSGCASLQVDFSDLSSGPVTSWSWDFGDGNTSTAQNPSNTYAAGGTYSVSLTATSAACSDSVTQTAYVTVSDTPVADFSGSPTAGLTPLTVDFTDLSGGGATSWSWTFGDGGSSTAQSPSHTYTTAGTYSVSLSVSNACGSDAVTKVDYITVTDPAQTTTTHVASISVTKQNLSQGNKRGVATVTIVDDNGAPVAGATVTGDFSGKTSDTGLSAMTDGNGQATLNSSSAKGGGEWCFTVTNVTHGSLAYDALQNNVTQACESGPAF